MNKYEIALDQITTKYLMVRDYIHGSSREEDMKQLDTLREAVFRVTARDGDVEPYFTSKDYKKGQSALVRLSKCKPYFFEDLRKGMYVYDRKLKRIVMIDEITETQEIVFTVISNERRFDEICLCRYEDDLFFPVHALYAFEGEILHTPEPKPEYPDYLWDKSKR